MWQVERFRWLAKRLLSARIPAGRVHQLLAWEYQARRLGWSELTRALYYQPMFETLCAEVGPGVRLELCPEAKVPVLWNVELRLGARVRVSARTTFSGARQAPTRPVIRIGDDSYVGGRCTLRAGLGITIGRHVLLASNALVSGDPGHPLDAEARRTRAASPESLTHVEIADDAWLAYNVSVLGGVRVGEGAVVAAGSIVTRDVPPHTLVAGNPARPIRQLRPEAPPPSARGHVRVVVPAGAPVGGLPNQLKVPPAEPLFPGAPAEETARAVALATHLVAAAVAPAAEAPRVPEALLASPPTAGEPEPVIG